MEGKEKWEVLIELLKGMQTELRLMNASVQLKPAEREGGEQVFLSFKGSEIYLLEKAFIDAGGSPNENYKSLLEKTVPYISNRNQKGGFSAQSFCKYSDKVDPESKETVKRFLMKMIRNIDSYD